MPRLISGQTKSGFHALPLHKQGNTFCGQRATQTHPCPALYLLHPQLSPVYEKIPYPCKEAPIPLPRPFHRACI